MRLLIKNARIISEKDGLDTIGSILAVNGQVACIALLEDEIDAPPECEVIDAHGLCLAPGLVDLFATVTEPEQEGLENLLTMSSAAAKGGYTTVCVHANISASQQAEYVRERGRYASCDIVVASRATLHREMLNYGELKEWGVRAVYDSEGIDNPLLMRDIMFRSRKHSLTLMSRCRDRRLYAEGLMREGGFARILDFPIIPASAEAVAVARDIILSMETGSHVHLGHISTAMSVGIIRIAKQNGVNITCSTEPHYLCLTSKEIQGFNTLAKLDPPLGNPEDVDALAQGLADGTIDCIASGHLPLPPQAKYKSLVSAAPGASSLETSLAACLTGLYHTGKISLPRLLDRMTAMPASVLGVKRGRIRVGDDADFVLFDPDKKWVCSGKGFISQGKSTPFEGKELTGCAVYTVKDGRIVWE